MVLSKRLETVLSMVKPAPVVADIGCDHGYIAIELIRRGIAGHVIAMDVRPGPLRRAREHVLEAGLSDRIELRISDGMRSLDVREADAAVIAGMGGPLMEKILQEGREKAAAMKQLILQPQSEIREFRRALREMGFQNIRNEVVSEDGKYYFPMEAVPSASFALEGIPQSAGEKGLTDPELLTLQDLYGADLLAADRGLHEYLSREADGLEELIARLQRDAAPAGRVEELKESLRLNRLAYGMCRQ